MRSARDYLKLAGKGMMMGAADAVPGVSGGTIAFITGIYEELIESIRRCDLNALRILFSQGIGACWRHINGTFLVTLLSGIIISLVSLARVVLYLLDNQPVLLWSFFFGLILASVWSLVRHVKGWNLNSNLTFLLGALVAYVITSMVPGTVSVTPWTLFGSGMLAICAMILPGISGSFILLLLGMYAPILAAVKGFEFVSLGLFVGGCVIGLISFSRLLSWAFHHHRRMILALLGGFMLGSLNKVWPWKYTLSYTLDRHGEAVPLLQRNVFPSAFNELTGLPAQLWPALALMLVGVVLVLVLDRNTGGSSGH